MPTMSSLQTRTWLRVAYWSSLSSPPAWSANQRLRVVIGFSRNLGAACHGDLFHSKQETLSHQGMKGAMSTRSTFDQMDNYFHEYRAEYVPNCASEESYATPVHQAGNYDLMLLQWMLAGIMPLDLTHPPGRLLNDPIHC